MSLKTLFLPVAMIIAISLIIWGILPQWDINQKIKSELESKKNTASQLEDSKNKLDQSIAVYDEKIEDVSVMYNALPTLIDNDALVGEIFNEAKNKGVVITSMTIGNVALAEKESNSKKMLMIEEGVQSDEAEVFIKQNTFKAPLTLELVGDYIDTKNFINFIESANRFFIVDNFNISQSDDENGGNIVNTSINIFCFYKRVNANLGIKSVIYTDDLVLRSLTSQQGLDMDYVSQYKAGIGNEGYAFGSLEEVGKSDLFSKN